MKKIPVLILFSLLSFSTHSVFADSQGELWEKMLPKFRSALKLMDEADKLPGSSLIKKDKKDNQEDINKLLNEAVNILMISEIQNYREQISEQQEKIQEIQKKITEYNEKRISAPEKKPVWKTWETTREEFDNKIEESKQEIKRREERIDEIEEQVRKELATLGLNVSPDQLDFLLSTVVGDNAIEVLVAFDNVKALTLQLETLTEQSGEDLETARRYYGMYTVLLEILDQMYSNIILDIDGVYIPQIQGGKDRNKKTVTGIIPKTEKLQKETEALLRKDSTGKNREVLTANLQAQKLTLEAAKLYRTYLEKQRSDIALAKKRLAPDLAAARNTYETVKVSNELVSMMKSGQTLFDALKNIQIPELRVFENLEMKQEFERLTVQLKATQQ